MPFGYDSTYSYLYLHLGLLAQRPVLEWKYHTTIFADCLTARGLQLQTIMLMQGLLRSIFSMLSTVLQLSSPLSQLIFSIVNLKTLSSTSCFFQILQYVSNAAIAKLLICVVPEDQVEQESLTMAQFKAFTMTITLLQYMQHKILALPKLCVIDPTNPLS